MPNVSSTVKQGVDTAAALVRVDAAVIDDIRVPYRAVGPDDQDSAVVFLHGNPGSSEDWVDLLSRIGPFSRGLAFDLPGFGQADKPPDFDYSVDGYVRFVGRALAHFGVRRVHFVLHDFGGPFGLFWMARNRDAVASLTLMNAGVLPGYRWHYLARIWRTPVVGEVFMATSTRPAFGLLLRHGNPSGLPCPFVDRMFRDFDRGTRRAVLRLYRATSKPGNAGDALAGALGGFDGPVIVLWGRHDPYIPVRYAEVQRSNFPNAEVVILDDSGHWPFADDPERTAAAVVPFLQHVTASDAVVRPREESFNGHR